MTPAEDPAFRAEVARMHAAARPIDAHTDTPLMLDHPRFDFAARCAPDSPLSQVDAPRIAEGGAAGVFFAIFTNQGPRTPEGHAYAWDLATRTIARTKSLLAENAASVALSKSPDDFEAITGAGRTAIFLGIENGWPIGRDARRVAELRALGASYLGLCHFANNDLSDSSTDASGSAHGGLSEFGRDVVAECNRVGLLVDVSHASDDAARQATTLSNVPIIASHSNCRAVLDHPRNLPDDIIRLIADKGGVVHVTICNNYVEAVPPGHPWLAARDVFSKRWGSVVLPDAETMRREWAEWEALYVGTPPALSTVARVVDHIDNVVRVAGHDHVGFGSDFNGGGMVAGCEDVSGLPAITTELLRRNWSELNIRKFWSGNTLRVLGEARRP